MKKLLVLVAMVAPVLAACDPEAPAQRREFAEKVRPTGDEQTEFSAGVLFEIDGCKVYRFYDKHHYRYFTVCKQGATNTFWLDKTGKHSYSPREISVSKI